MNNRYKYLNYGLDSPKTNLYSRRFPHHSQIDDWIYRDNEELYVILKPEPLF